MSETRRAQAEEDPTDQIAVDYEENSALEPQPGEDDVDFGYPDVYDDRAEQSLPRVNETAAEFDANGNIKIPDKLPEGIIAHVLFVSRFHFASTTAKHVRELMEPFGKLKDVVMKSTLAFVDFEKDEDAIKAKYSLHRRPGLGSDSLIVDFKKLNRFRVSRWSKSFALIEVKDCATG